MDRKYQYNEGDKIKFKINDEIQGTGIICGCASEPIPPLGRMWLVKVDEPTPFIKEVYPFGCITVFDIQIVKEE
jgi:hypothetical protein